MADPDISPTSLNITWIPPDIDDRNGILLNYTITYTSSLDGQNNVMTTPDTDILLTGLDEFTEYLIVVNATTSKGTGPGAETTVLTQPDGMQLKLLLVLNLSLLCSSYISVIRLKCLYFISKRYP